MDLEEFIADIDRKDATTNTFYKSEGKISFDPLVYEQRYIKTIRILGHQKFKHKIKRIVEFGSAELKFFVYMKNGLKRARRIDLVDIDEELVTRFKTRINPLMAEHLRKREYPMKVNVWAGDIAISNPNFTDVDAVVAIELIEHVFPPVLEEIPYKIFGDIRPKIAVFTTPNGEFNVLFHLKPFQYRHDDHKFEWTRSEFQDWCNNICDRFPEYCVQFHGVGKPPEGHEHLGSCSQLGLFIRKDFLESANKVAAENPENDEGVEELEAEEIEEQVIESDGYKLVHSVDFPFFRDTRNRNEKILEECSYHLMRFRSMEEDYFNYELDRFEIPFENVASCCWQITEDYEEVANILKNNFETENNMVLFPAMERSERDDDENYGDEEPEKFEVSRSSET